MAADDGPYMRARSRLWHAARGAGSKSQAGSTRAVVGQPASKLTVVTRYRATRAVKDAWRVSRHPAVAELQLPGNVT